MSTDNYSRHTTKRSPRWLLSAAALLALAAPVAPADDPDRGLEMVVYSDTAQGRRLIRGETDTRATREAVERDRFEAHNNRCVSLTLSGDLERAEVVCNDAVRAARRSAAAGRSGFSPQSVSGNVRTNRAMAYTNRGVLRALQGDRAGAWADFEVAQSLSPRVSAATNNLARLAEVVSPTPEE